MKPNSRTQSMMIPAQSPDKMKKENEHKPRLSEVIKEDIFSQKLEENFFVRMDRENQKKFDDLQKHTPESKTESKASSKHIFQHRRMGSTTFDSKSSRDSICSNELPAKAGSLQAMETALVRKMQREQREDYKNIY